MKVASNKGATGTLKKNRRIEPLNLLPASAVAHIGRPLWNRPRGKFHAWNPFSKRRFTVNSIPVGKENSTSTKLDDKDWGCGQAGGEVARYPATRYETCGQDCAHRRSDTADAEDGHQSRRPTNRAFPRDPRRSFTVLSEYHHVVLRRQQLQHQCLTRSYPRRTSRKISINSTCRY